MHYAKLLIVSAVLLFSLLACAGVVREESALSAEKKTPAGDLGVLSGEIDDARIYGRFFKAGRALMKCDDILTPDDITKSVELLKGSSTIPLPVTPVSKTLEYSRMVKSTLLLGTLYNCGKCEHLHPSVAGGVVVSADGLALTNYHVLDRDEKDVKVVFAMTVDGQTHPIEEVLSADEDRDVVLFRLGGEGPFFPAPIAVDLPTPLDAVTVLSHPKGHFFVTTDGIVSRHVKVSSRNSAKQWTEITADYAAGSSGSGVFNSRGELVGLVSTNTPISRELTSSKPKDSASEEHNEEQKARYTELVLRRCVTLDSIKSCFAE